MRSRPYREAPGRDWPGTLFALVLTATFLFACTSNIKGSTVARADGSLFRVVTLVEGLEHPWSMAFLPDGDILVTERPGQLRRVTTVAGEHKLVESPLFGLPKIQPIGQGGLLDVVLHPDHENNSLVYLSYSARDRQGYGTQVARGRLESGGLRDVEVIFVAEPKSSNSSVHFGSRMLFDDDEFLFITLGDRGNRDTAQDLASHPGSVIRLHDDGSIPKDNPFVGQLGARPEIYSYGHRNPQGLTRDPVSGRIFVHEHGPQGGDEINVINRGGNYGWPIVSYGEEYGGGEIGEGTTKAGLVNPAWVWVPSIAPSGLAWYSGDKFPNWQGNLFVGALKFRLIARLELEGAKVLSEERMLENEFGRIRDVRQGPDGFVYVLTDSGNGKLLRLEPLSQP